MSENYNDVVYQRGKDAGSDAWDDTVLIKAYDNAVSAMKAKFAEQHPEFSVTPSSNSKKKKKNKQKQKKKHSQHQTFQAPTWKLGDICQAVFTEDEEVYTAKIVEIDEDSGTCTVKYVGYGNEEEQLLEDLMPVLSGVSSFDNKTDTANESESSSIANSEREKANCAKQRPSPRNKAHRHSANGKPSKSNIPQWPWDTFTGPPLPSHFPPFQPPPNFPGYTSGFAAPMPSTFPLIPPPPPLFGLQTPENDTEAMYSMLISWYMSGYHTGYYQGLKNAAKTSSGASSHVPHR